MTLIELAQKFNSEKWFNHSYMPVYQDLLGKSKVKRLLEIGIGYRDLMVPFLPEGIEYCHGSSLRMWSSYWPDAEVWACDIREDTLVNEGNIRSVVCDQSSGKSLAEMVFTVTDGLKHKFDVIIDDGSHQFEHQKLTADVLLPRVAEGGVYIIEDCYPDTGSHLAARYGGYCIVGNKRPDDTLVVIQRRPA